ncbi:MAG: trypsin-like peptidase domain-containing protein [Vicinamibacterales bacterium]
MTSPLWRITIGGCIAFAAGIGLAAVQGTPSPRPNALPPVTDLVSRIMPSVVTISSPQGTLASGVIVRDDGVVVTNRHVVEGVTELSVTLSSGEKVAARVKALHPDADLALLQTDVGRKLPAASLTQRREVQVGEWVVAIGNPFGLGPTASIGIIGATGQSLGRTGLATQMIQTDAAINPGNSGGPLIDMQGDVVAIANAAVTIGQGIGFAVPIHLAVEMLGAPSKR